MKGTLDLVIQAADLAPAAVDAFRVACLAQDVIRSDGAARLSGVGYDAETRKVVDALARYWKCDAALVAPDLRLSSFRLLALDMDSTLITIECVDALAARAGRGAEVAAITEATMRGEIADFGDSLRRRVALLQGLPGSELAQVYDEQVRLSPGAERLIGAVRAAGLRTLLVSGGFTFFTERLQASLQLDDSVANELEIVDGRLTGAVAGPGRFGGTIVDSAGKARALAQACAAIGCAPSAAIAIGDGANDLDMLRAAGLSVAYRAKPRVQQEAAQRINYGGLETVLEWFAPDQPRSKIAAIP
jgi:phosphoserine phosphatase